MILLRSCEADWGLFTRGPVFAVVDAGVVCGARVVVALNEVDTLAACMAFERNLSHL